jgi:chromosome segregation ATPase
MAPARTLPILNLLGCLVLTGLIVAMWQKEQGLVVKNAALATQLAAREEQLTAEKKHAADLSLDISQLKESVESTVRSHQELEASLAKITSERNALTSGSVTVQETQAKVWQTAIAERDVKIKELNTALTATRERLDQAIVQLKSLENR